MLCVQLCQLMSDLCIICTIPLTLCGTGATFSTMKLITTIVRPERLPEVKAALLHVRGDGTQYAVRTMLPVDV